MLQLKSLKELDEQPIISIKETIVRGLQTRLFFQYDYCHFFGTPMEDARERQEVMKGLILLILQCHMSDWLHSRVTRRSKLLF